jgi:hypothetical protein
MAKSLSSKVYRNTTTTDIFLQLSTITINVRFSNGEILYSLSSLEVELVRYSHIEDCFITYYYALRQICLRLWLRLWVTGIHSIAALVISIAWRIAWVHAKVWKIILLPSWASTSWIARTTWGKHCIPIVEEVESVFIGTSIGCVGIDLTGC